MYYIYALEKNITYKLYVDDNKKIEHKKNILLTNYTQTSLSSLKN